MQGWRDLEKRITVVVDRCSSDWAVQVFSRDTRWITKKVVLKASVGFWFSLLTSFWKLNWPLWTVCCGEATGGRRWCFCKDESQVCQADKLSCGFQLCSLLELWQSPLYSCVSGYKLHVLQNLDKSSIFFLWEIKIEQKNIAENLFFKYPHNSRY